MPRVIIEHPDRRQYGVELATFFSQYQAHGFKVVRQLYQTDLAGALGDPATAVPEFELDAAAKEPGQPYEATIVAAGEPPTVILPGVPFLGHPIDPTTGVEATDAVG